MNLPFKTIILSLLEIHRIVMSANISLYPKSEAVRRMNVWGAERRPFIFIVDYKQESSFVELVENVDPNLCLYDFNGVTNAQGMNCEKRTEQVYWKTYPENEESYAKAFDVVRRNILAGNSFLANLTRSTPVETNLSLKEIFFRSKALYRLWVKNRFVCFSPEIFVRIKQGNIYAYPMKGTIDATLPDARRRLTEDVKEAAEHATIVDLLRNDLSMHASEVKVCRYRYFDRLQTNKGAIYQTSSEIGGVLPSDYRERLGNILFDMLPAGSITGAPKPKTTEIIEEAEGYDRGFYTGVAGYFDGDNLDSCVLIRFLEQNAGGFSFKAGGGITFQSDAHSEYEEVIQKIYVPIY